MLQTMAFALAGVMPAAVKTGLFVSKCSVFQQNGNFGSSGAPSGVYDVLVIANIPCMDAVPREGVIEATEMRGIKDIQSKGYRHVLLAGFYYPELFPLIQQGLQASIADPDGTTVYNLFGVEPDSQNTQTRLHLEVISV
jgi:hypothetical protein